MWHTLTEHPIPDIGEWVRTATTDGQLVHIGTDSMQFSRVTQFVTVVAIITPGKGGRAAYRRHQEPRIRSLRERLAKEVHASVGLALVLAPIAPSLTVHVDANPSPAHKSGLYVQELVGAVVGQGFRYAIKPDAWCASTAADRIVRYRSNKCWPGNILWHNGNVA